MLILVGVMVTHMGTDGDIPTSCSTRYCFTIRIDNALPGMGVFVIPAATGPLTGGLQMNKSYRYIHGPAIGVLGLQMFGFVWGILGMSIGVTNDLVCLMVAIMGFTSIMSAVMLAAEEV